MAFSSVVAASIVVVMSPVAAVNSFVAVEASGDIVICVADKTSVLEVVFSGVAVAASVVTRVSFDVVACIKFIAFAVMDVVSVDGIVASVGVVEASVEVIIMAFAVLVVDTVMTEI